MSDIIYNRVAQLRAQAGETQQELADAVGVSRQTIIAIEKGNYTPSVALALKLATHYTVPVDALFSLKRI